MMLLNDDQYERQNINVLLTILIPVYEESDFWLRTLVSLSHQKKVDFKWNILLIGQIGNTKNIDGVIQNKYLRIQKIQIDRFETKQDLINIGFQLAEGQWISLIDKNYIFLDDSIYQMGKLIAHINLKGKKQTAYIGLWYKTLRIENGNDTIFYEEIEKTKQELQDSLINSKEYKVSELSWKHTKTYGTLGNIEPQNGSLYLKKAIVDVGGFDVKDVPIENNFLVLKLQDNYKTMISARQYGIFLSMDSTYKNRKELLMAAYKWTEYLYGKSKSVYVIRKKRNDEKMYMAFRYLSGLIQKHRSFGMKLDDFDDMILGLPDLKRYIWIYTIRSWLYEKKVIRQNRLYDRNLYE